MKKRSAAILLTMALVIACFSMPVSAAGTALDTKDIYYTPASDYRSGDCILTASKMMIRRACIITGRGDWTRISNKSIRGSATISGLLLNSFRIDQEGLVYKIESARFSGKSEKARKKEIEELLKTHPEGIVVHGEKASVTGPHGVLVTAVKSGTVYAADSTRNTGLNNKGIQKWKDTTMLTLDKVNKYWYISEIKSSSKTKPHDDINSEKTLSSLKIRSVRVPSKIKCGRGFTINGKVSSNKSIRKVTVRILNSSGSAVVSVSKKPNAKSFNIKKLDKKVRFGKLKKGRYTFQVIATDSTQKLKLVNRQFKVR